MRLQHVSFAKNLYSRRKQSRSPGLPSQQGISRRAAEHKKTLLQHWTAERTV